MCDGTTFRITPVVTVRFPHGMLRLRHHGGDQFINLRSPDLPLEVSEQSASTIGDGRFLDKLPDLQRKNSDENAVLILKLEKPCWKCTCRSVSERYFEENPLILWALIFL